MKICSTCETLKSADCYYAQSRGSGLCKDCKECVKARVRAYRAANIERVKAYDRKRGLAPERKEKVRQRAHKYKNKPYAKSNHWRQKNPVAYAAHIVVGNALRDGRLTRESCEKCGKRAQAHHDDYGEPLSVRWLCRTHHGQHHREARDKERAL